MLLPFCYFAHNLPIVLYGCETWSLTPGEEYRLGFENRVPRRVLESKREEVVEE
jgi:hypothetical protein